MCTKPEAAGNWQGRAQKLPNQLFLNRVERIGKVNVNQTSSAMLKDSYSFDKSGSNDVKGESGNPFENAILFACRS